MAKQIVKENVRVEITPVIIGYHNNPEEEVRDCEQIKQEALRHIDNVGSIDVLYDTRIVCEFCGYEWEVNEDPDDPDFGLGEPVCCTKAQKEWEQEQGEKNV